MDILELFVKKIDSATGEAILVTLRASNGQTVNYEAGQFLTFLFPTNVKEIRRSYSICSTPGIDEDIDVLIKRRVNGAISRHLFDHLKLGNLLYSLYPAGRFTLSVESARKRTVFFIAAGSGISPIYALLKKLLAGEPLSQALLIYQNRDESSILLKSEIEALHQKHSTRFTWINLLSNPLSKNHIPRRLNNALLEEILFPYFKEQNIRDFYLCGPAGFMRMAQFVLKVMGATAAQIHKENFEIPVIPPAPLMDDHSPKQIILQWKNNSYSFSVSYPETILEAAFRNNIQLPFSCRGGSCATCIATCTSGKVIMSINEVLTAKDLQAGLVLTCVGYALTDLQLTV